MGAELVGTEIAGPTEATCKPCEFVGDQILCDENITTERLTSGYYYGETGPELDAPLPVGISKCTHGGLSDETDPKLNLSGINKDTTVELLSPHWALHGKAVAAATDATHRFFTGVRAGADEQHFRNLFTASGSFGVAMDLSSGMSDIRSSVADQVTSSVEKRRTTQSYDNKLVFVGFSDAADSSTPALTPQYAGQNFDWFKDLVKGTSVRDGGDCPEASLEATLEVLKSSEPGGVIFLITDADPTTPALATRINQLARQRRVAIHTLLLEPTGASTCPIPGGNAYRTMAASTGGQVHALPRPQAAMLSSKMIWFNQPAHGVTLSTGKLVSPSSTKSGGHLYPILLDSTSTSVTIVATGVAEVELTRPDGTAVTPDDASVTRVALNHEVLFSLTQPIAGTWMLSSQDEPEQLSVSSNSALEITALEFLAPAGRLGHEGLFPIDGAPVAGQEQAVGVDLSQPVQTPLLELRSPTNELLASAPLVPRPGGADASSDDGRYGALLTIPKVPFVAYVKGTLLNGQPFERSYSGVTQPQYIAVSAPPQQRFYAGERHEYEFVLRNQGAADRFALNVDDDRGFVTSDKRQTIELAAGATARVVVTAQAPTTTAVGTESVVHLDVASTSNAELVTDGKVSLEVTENLDLDLDTIPNGEDNCVEIANRDQLDNDRDGQGNACDATIGEPPPETGCRTTRGSEPLGSFMLTLVLMTGLLRRRNGRNA